MLCGWCAHMVDDAVVNPDFMWMCKLLLSVDLHEMTALHSMHT